MAAQSTVTKAQFDALAAQVAALSAKVDGIATRVAAHDTLAGRIDALAATVTTLAAKVDALAAKVDAIVIAPPPPPPPPPPQTAQYAAMTKPDGSPLYMERALVGQDSVRYFDKVLTRNGCMLEYGANNHATEQNNSVGFVDPVAGAYVELIPWQQQKSATDPTPLIPPNMATGFNQYVATYDNYPAMLMESLGWLVYPGFGVADLNAKKWLCGSRPPFTAAQGWKSYIKLDVQSEAAFDNGASVYDTCTLNVPALDICIVFGSNTGPGSFSPYYFILRKNPNYPGDPRPLEMVALPKTPHTWLRFGYNMGCGAVNGAHALIGGGALDDGLGTQNRNVYLVDLSACPAGGSLVLLDTFANAIPACVGPHPVGVWPQMIYHPPRGRYVLLGRRVYELNPATRVFEQVTIPNYGLLGVPGLTEGGGFDSPGAALAADGAILIKGGNAVQPDGTVFGGSKENARIYRLYLDAPTQGGGTGGGSGGGTTTGGGTATPALSTKSANPQLWSGANNKHSKLFRMPDGRVYKFGGDGDLASGHGQPRSGQDVPMPDGSHLICNGDRGLHGGQLLGMVSFDPKADVIEERLEFPMIPRNVGTAAAPVPEPCSLKVCEGSAWVDKDGRAYLYAEHDYGMYAYFNAPDGKVLNRWANGEMENPNAPNLANNMRGIYELLPQPGAMCKQRLHSTARMLNDTTGKKGLFAPEYDSVDPKILWRPEGLDPDSALADCAYDAASHRAYWIGGAHVYAYNHALAKFESYPNSWGSIGGFDWYVAQGSNVACCNGRLYHLATTQAGGKLRYCLAEIDLTAMLAGTNVAKCTTLYDSPFPFWHSGGYPELSGVWNRYVGVRAAAGRVALIGSYHGILQDGISRAARFECGSKQWVPTPPATRQMFGNAWCALDDSVLFACSTASTAAEVNYLRMAA